MTDLAHRRQVTFQHRVEYDLLTSINVLRPENDALLSVGKTKNARRFVVVDANVDSNRSAEIRRYFSQNRIEARIVVFPGGEENKTVESFVSIAKELDAFPIDRRGEPIIAIGGGVLTDVVGFVAGSFRRGVPYIKVPTTLVGYVDASVGIKTGVNFNGHKNRLGAFVAPQRVVLDKSFLKTLPKRHVRNGVCEIVKLAVIHDIELFRMLETAGRQSIESLFQDEHAEPILDRAIGGMLEELQPNLFEENLARKVDFGHTFSYGLETLHGSELLHGEAVLLDVVVSTLIARKRSLLSASEVERIFSLIADLGLPLRKELLDPLVLRQSLEERTHHRNGLQRVPLPDGIGGCTFVEDVNAEEIETAVVEVNRIR